MYDGGDGESNQNQSGQPDAELDQVKFLTSLVTHYESLVQDMTRELSRCQNEIKCQYQNQVLQVQDPALSGELDELRAKHSLKDSILQNLITQVEVCKNTKSVVKKLWQDTLHHVETLESSTSSGNIKHQALSPLGASLRSLTSPSNFLMKWKLLQSYAQSLENRLEASTKEKNFYRNKIMEVRIQHETILKRHAVETSREVEQTKSSYMKEIHYLKSALEKHKKQQQIAWEKRVKSEKEIWEYQQSKKLQLVKLQVEQLIMENDMLSSREMETSSRVRQLESQLQIAKQWIQPDQQTPRLAYNSKHVQVQCSEEKPKNSMHAQTEFDFIDPDQFKNFKTSHTQLKVEYDSILSKFETSENNSNAKLIRLQERIKELEKRNSNFIHQINEINDKNSTTSEKEHKHNPDDQYKTEEVTIKVPKINNIYNTAGRLPLDISDGKECENHYHCTWKNENRNEASATVNESRWKLKILNLNQEIQKLKNDRTKLLEVVEKQKNIASKWKAEFKELAKRTIF